MTANDAKEKFRGEIVVFLLFFRNTLTTAGSRTCFRQRFELSKPPKRYAREVLYCCANSLVENQFVWYVFRDGV